MLQKGITTFNGVISRRDVLKGMNVSAFLDNWGPAHVLQVYDPDYNMQGILVLDNLSLGPGCGGIRISPHIMPYDVFLHARTMTWACALAGVKLGGAAAGIRANPFEIDRTKYVRSFAREVSQYVPNQYIATAYPYVGMNEMAAFIEEVGDRRGAAGKPEKMDGIPYELGVIGLGMGVAIEETINAGLSLELFPSDISNARIAIQGLESIGSSLAKFLLTKGTKVVSLSDEWCSINDPEGININEILEHFSAANSTKSLKDCKGYKKLPKDAIITTECDVLVCTNGSNLVTAENIGSLNTRCVVEGVNKPITPIAEGMLHKKGVMILPDIISMISSAVSSYAEYRMDSPEMAFSVIEDKTRETTKLGIKHSLASGIPVRRVLREIAKERIIQTREVSK